MATQKLRAAQVDAGEITLTTTGNIDALDPTGLVLVRMNNASLATIRGILAGVAGQRLTIVSVGAGQVNLAHQHATPTAANRLINSVTFGDTPLAAGIGTAILEYDSTTARWRLISHRQGRPIDIPYNAGDFTASAGTWTVDAGDVEVFAYLIEGRLLTLFYGIATATVSNAGVILQLNLAGYRATNTSYQFQRAGDGAAPTVSALARVVAAGTVLQVFATAAGAGWSIQTNLQSTQGTFVCLID